MRLYWVEYCNGYEDRDNMFALDDGKDLASQAIEALGGLNQSVRHGESNSIISRTSAGVFHPKVLRGRPFISSATRSRSI